jgi:hypothetical protein
MSISSRLQDCQKCVEESGDNPYYVIAVTPLFLNDEIVNIRDRTLRRLLENPPAFGNNDLLSLRNDSTRPTIHGLMAKRGEVHSIELFRHGHMELSLKANQIPLSELVYVPSPDGKSQQECFLFNPYALNAYLLYFIHLTNAVFTHIGLTDPVVVTIGFYGIKGFALHPKGLWSPPFFPAERVWKKRDLEIPPMTFSSLSPTEKTTKECLDRIWQAFGHEQAFNIPWEKQS